MFDFIYVMVYVIHSCKWILYSFIMFMQISYLQESFVNGFFHISFLIFWLIKNEFM